jgi:hypothetical protein
MASKASAGLAPPSIAAVMASIPDPIASAKPSGFAPIISITPCGISGILAGNIVIEIKLPKKTY